MQKLMSSAVSEVKFTELENFQHCYVWSIKVVGIGWVEYDFALLGSFGKSSFLSEGFSAVSSLEYLINSVFKHSTKISANRPIIEHES